MKNKKAQSKKLIALLIALGLITILLLAFAVNKDTTGKIVSEKEPIKIGAILPISGSVAYLGQFEKQGIDLAVKEINDKGGINGRTLEIIYEDSKGETKEAVSAYQKLTQVEGINVLLTTESGTTLALAPLAEKDKVIIFSIAGADSKISNAGDYIFRHNLMPIEESAYISDFIFSQGYDNIGVLVINSDSGNSYSNEIKKSFEQLGGHIILTQKYEKGAKDFRTELTKIKESKVKAVFLFTHAKDIGLILKQSEELGIKDIQWFGSFSTEGSDLLNFGGKSCEGIIYSHFFNPESQDFKFLEFEKSFNKTYNKQPEPFSSLAYDNIYILAEAMENCKNPEDATCIKDNLYKIKDFPGVTGKISFDSNGDTHKDIIIKTVKNGQFVKYEQ